MRKRFDSCYIGGNQREIRRKSIKHGCLTDGKSTNMSMGMRFVQTIGKCDFYERYGQARDVAEKNSILFHSEKCVFITCLRLRLNFFTRNYN